ncbi:MAG: toll/interleukin-1 receptor domain-containing protein [Chloroflexota bacterium]|nr:toll/interleukin-1 receptor domain-containing protein [Chloroflexota bacterium]
MRRRLDAHLKLLEHQGLISPWHFRKIGAGEEWKGAIDRNLAAADIVLLLISASFLASPYCYDVEMTRALRRHKAGRARVIPVILRDVSWKSAPFSGLQVLPTDGKPITDWRPQDKGWADVAKGVEDAVKKLRAPVGRTVSAPTRLPAAKPPVQRPRAATTPPSIPRARSVNVQMMLSRAEKLVPQRSHDFTTRLCVVVAGDVDQVVRPAALTVALGQTIQQHTQFGRTRILSPAHKTDIRSEGDAVIIEQPDTSILVDQQGSVRIITIAPQRQQAHGPALGVVEEDVRDHFAFMLRAVDRILKDIDPKRTMTEVVILGAVLTSGGVSWKREAEYLSKPQTWGGSMKSGPFRAQLTPPQRPRIAIVRDATKIAEDITALLRMQIVG